MRFTTFGAVACAMVLALAGLVVPETDGARAQAHTVRPVQFDGKELYKAAFEAIRDKHRKLLDANARDAWSKEWQHKFDSDPSLATEAGADQAIRAMLGSLGMRYDKYLGGDYVQITESLGDATASIGVVLKARMEGGRREIYVERLLPGSPAENVLMAGDVIVAIECLEGGPCRDVGDMTGTEVELALYGKQGSQITLIVRRQEESGPKDLRLTLTRKEMSEHVVVYDDSYAGVAVIKVINFLPANFEEQFEAAMKKATSLGVKGIVIDLRGNPGGRTDAAVNAVGNLLVEGKINVIVQRQGSSTLRVEIAAKGQHFEATVLRVNVGQRFPTPRPAVLVDQAVKIAVVIDGKSASASEIFAGALQVNKRATIVGEKSQGKGDGQEVVELPFRRRLIITTFEFLAGGVPHNLKGIQPDLHVPAGTASGADEQLEQALRIVSSPASERAE